MKHATLHRRANAVLGRGRRPVAAALWLVLAGAAAAGSQEKSNFVYGELGGAGLLSANYERALFRRHSLPLGLGTVPVPEPASPRSAVPAARGVPRDGSFIGFSLGWSLDDGYSEPPGFEQEGQVPPGAELHVGGMLGRRFALVGEIGSLGYVAAAAQWWADRAGRLWLKGGIGLAGSVSLGGGSMLIGAGGVEVIRAGRFVVDAQVRIAGFQDERYVIVGAGFNWY